MNKTKQKILLLGLTKNIGGVETFICNILQYIDKEKYQVDCLSHQIVNENVKNVIENNGGRIYYVSGIKNNPFKYLKEIRNFYNEHKEYEIIHANVCDATYFIYYFPILFKKNVKLIVHSHNSQSNHKVIHYILRPLQNAFTNEKLACSNEAALWMFGRNCKKYKIVKNGVDLDKYQYKKKIAEKVKKEINGGDKFVIGSVARFTEQKNHVRIISVFEEYLKINNNSILVLVGDGPNLENIKNLVKEKNLSKCVLFLGIRDGINEILMAFDLFLMPSLYEGLPFVAIEAQASGLPMLVANTVSKEAKITTLVEYESLTSNDHKWAERIENIRKKTINRNSKEYQEQIKKAEFDVKDTIEDLSNIYTNLRKKN